MVDSARVGDIRNPYERAAEISSLYEGEAAKEFQEVAPHIVAINHDAALLQQTLDGWGRAWGMYLSCDRSIAEVRKHLRRFLRVTTEDGEFLYFRYYDPRVLRVFLPTCTPDQIAEFFGPIHAFWVEAEEPSTCLVFRREKGEIWPEKIDLSNLPPI